MIRKNNAPIGRDKILFTPGPLTTSPNVKLSMLHDIGSRDKEFIELVKSIRQDLVGIAMVDETEYTSVLLQGSGTFGLESVISSTVPPYGKIMIIVNGVYGRRMMEMADVYKIEKIVLEYPENAAPDIEEISRVLKSDKSITNVAVVHCETTSGIMNPIEEIGRIVKNENRIFIVDAVTTFGAYSFNPSDTGIDYLVADSSKCFEGVPGFSIILAKTEELKNISNYKRTLCLDLYSQWKELEISGEFRFTPPTHSLLAFRQALNELIEETVERRAARYKENCEVLIAGMRKMGFREYLFPNLRSYVITSFLFHDHPNFDFDKFYTLLRDKGQIIYKGKLSNYEGFRIGTMGRLFPNDVKVLINAIEETMKELNISFRKNT